MNIIKWLKEKAFAQSSTEAVEPDKPSSPKVPNKIKKKASSSSIIKVKEIIVPVYPKSPSEKIFEFESFSDELEKDEI